MRHKKTTIIFLAIALAFVGTGFVAALNGYFGGGDTIPEDTFTRGLVGYWSFDEGTGQTAYDASGNGNNGILGASSGSDSGDPRWTISTASAPSNVGGGLLFDGVDDYVEVPYSDSLDFGAGYVTYECWIKTSQSCSGARVYVSRYQGSGSTSIWLDCVDSSGNGKAYFGVRDSDGVLVGSGNSVTTINDGAWHHLVGVKSGNNVYIYVDGVLENSGSGSFTGNFNFTVGIAIGAHILYDPDYFAIGTIDEVRIYNRALSAEEIRYHYNRGGPVASWNFDEGSGSTIYDSSGNQHHGTLHE